MRGQPVEDALNILAFSPQRAAGLVSKVLESAIANAEHNEGADIDELKVGEIRVDEGITLKRMRPRARGSRQSHPKANQPRHHSGDGRRRVAARIEEARIGRQNGVRKLVQQVCGSASVAEHRSVWYAEKETYAEYLLNDLEVREYLAKRLAQASVSRIDIERPAQTARVTIHTARPGIVIGKKGEDVERLRYELTEIMGVPVHVNVGGGAQTGDGCVSRRNRMWHSNSNGACNIAAPCGGLSRTPCDWGRRESRCASRAG